jgi:PFU (PLAA family ubiquitin binding)/WD domain, G-beta repeat
MDNVIRLFDPAGNPLLELEGHTKGVISFSWTADKKLISGSWDGTARVWDLESGGACIQVLGPHENGVQVLGTTDGNIWTTSTGESVDDKPANFQIRSFDPATGQQTRTSIKDHDGPIRSISRVPTLGGFATTSNDGTVRIRAADGSCIGSVLHPVQDDGSPPFVLSRYATISSRRSCSFFIPSQLPFTPLPWSSPVLAPVLACSVVFSAQSRCARLKYTCILMPHTSLDSATLETASGMDIVSCGEDGSVVVWENLGLLQSIPHPSCVWCVLPLSDGDFLTGSYDGVIRHFSRNPAKTSTAQAIQMNTQFVDQVQQAAARKRSGPTSEEISKATKWEQRGAHPGKSEGQVMVFNKDGVLIAAQWASASGAWIEVGEVTGSGDGGSIDGVHYDIVMPVEMDTPHGVQVRKTSVPIVTVVSCVCE